MYHKSSAGFSLVELMVALLIGLVIILGAGQLFLTGFQNFRQIERLSDRQSVMMFSADVLLKDVRRSGPEDISHTSDSITLTEGTYSSDCPDPLPPEGCSLQFNDGVNQQPVAAGLHSSQPLLVEEVVGGHHFYRFTIRFLRNDDGYDELVFHAQNRSSKFQ